MSSTPSRCGWALTGGPQIGDAYLRYHDEVWGVPERDPHTLFEFLILEGAQAGLSWSTILRKLDGYRSAYDGFDPEVIARYGDDDVARLLADAGIVRNRAKIEATIANARAVLDLRDAGRSLTELVWSHAPADPRPTPRATTFAQVPASTPQSVALARSLKAAGFRFVGPTTAYAAMQACGLVDDHLAGCPVTLAR